MIKHQYNFVKSKGQVNNHPSLTLPDQTMSLREIITRYARGLPITSLAYQDDADDENADYHEFQKMDKIEKIEYVRNYQEYVKKLREKLDQEEKAELKAREAGQKDKIGRKTQIPTGPDGTSEGTEEGSGPVHENFVPKAEPSKSDQKNSKK